MKFIFFLLFTVYAVTPGYLYPVTASSGNAGNASRRYTVKGIVWADVVLSAVDADDELSLPGAISARQVSHMILVKKKRALAREQSGVKPLFSVKMLSSGESEQPLFRFAEFEIVQDPLLRESAVPISLNTGLSPPSSILS